MNLVRCSKCNGNKGFFSAGRFFPCSECQGTGTLYVPPAPVPIINEAPAENVSSPPQNGDSPASDSETVPPGIEEDGP